MELALGTRMQKRVLNNAFALYDSGNTSRIKIPVGYLFRRLWMRINGSLNISGAGTVKSEAPLGLISKIALVADGSRTIFAASARDLFRLAHFQTSKVPELLAPTGTGAAVPITAAIPFFFEAVRRVAPADSLFDSAPYAELYLEITWAALSAIYTGGTASVNATTRLEVVVEDTTKGHEQVGLIKRISYVEKVVSATQTDFEIDLPKSGLLDRILIRADRDDVPDDTLINTVTMRHDQSFDLFKAVSWANLQNIGVSEHSIDGGAASTGRVAGYALLDPVENGMLTSAPNLRAMIDPKLVFDVTLGSGTTRIIRATIESYEFLSTPAAA